MNRKTILLIDDDTLFLMLTSKILGDQPYLERIDTATTVEEARQYFQDLEAKSAPFPDAVFVDLDMPLVCGLEMAQQLRDTFLAAHPQTKIFILSSSISHRDRQTAASLEAVTDYMEKPLSPDILKQALGLGERHSGDRHSLPCKQNAQKEEKSKP